MNQYEELVFTKNTAYGLSVVGAQKVYNAQIDPTKKFVLKQEEDINLTKYQFIVFCHTEECPLEKVSIHQQKKWTAVTRLVNNKEKQAILENADKMSGAFKEGSSIFVITLDFENKIDKIKFEYKNGIVDPIEIKIEYVEANKDAYYERIAAKKRDDLLKKMSVTCKTGDSLVNVFWQNASNEVKKTVFELFLDNQQPIMKSELDSDTLFKSVQGLAYGSYLFRLTQLDASNNIIVQTDYIAFKLSRQGGHGGKHVVVI